jgi:hypothetical protein
MKKDDKSGKSSKEIAELEKKIKEGLTKHQAQAQPKKKSK